MTNAYDRAANALNELSHRLADVGTEQFMAEQEYKRMREENAKLREFALDVLLCSEGDFRCEGCHLWRGGKCVSRKVAHELGIEVD